MTAPLLRYLLSACLLLCSGTLYAQQEIKIGILADQEKSTSVARWSLLAAELSKDMPEYHFSVLAYDYPQLQSAVAARQIDFVLTHPSHYLLMASTSGLSAPIVTLVDLMQGKPVTARGGVIFTRAERTDINSLQDLRGKRVATATTDSLSGYQMQAFELSRAGITPQALKLITTGDAQGAVLAALFSGRADVAFYPSGVLERLAEDGLLDRRKIKILNQQNLPDYPASVSTRLYPSWPFSALPQTNKELMRKVAASLLELQENTALTRKLHIQGFNVASDYTSVADVLLELHLPPYDVTPAFTAQDVLQRYRWPILSGLLAISLILLLGLGLLLSYRRLNFEKRIVSRQASQLKESNTLLDNIINNIPVMIFLKQAKDLRFHLLNRTGEVLLGLDKDTLLGRTDSELFPKEQAAHAMRTDRLALAQDSGVEITEETIETPQGTRILHTKKLSLRDAQGNPQYLLGISEDITERKAAASEIERLAFYDPLTRLPNRRLLIDRLELGLHNCMRNSKQGALLFIDLDHFKNLNDTLGHDIGDQLLQQVALRLQACVREGDTVARFGGDEFVVILENLDHQTFEAATQCKTVGTKILVALNQNYLLENHLHHSTPSVGITLIRDPHQTVEALLKEADIALYQAKKDGRNCMRFFDLKMQVAVNRRVELEAEIRQAIAHQQFQLHYQIQVDSRQQPVGAEALIRWLHPVRGMIYPAEFIPLADETGLIVPIGLWVLETACARLKLWEQDALTRDLVLAINVSAKQFREKHFVSQVQKAINDHGINPARLKFELTESMLLDNLTHTIEAMNALNEVGIQFSLDDFGTGYSSLQYLKRLPLDQLKIDQSFVRDLARDPNDKAIVRTIIAMAQGMDLQIIAEGVEHEAQRQLLLNKGCRYFQGNLFGEPLPAALFEDVLKNKHEPPRTSFRDGSRGSQTPQLQPALP